MSSATTPGAAAVPHGEAGVSRWWRVVGGLLMNLALGSLYAWSVFVAPLEKEFGWKRADTTQVFTWAVDVFAISFILAGRLQDKIGPFAVSLTGCILLTIGFLLSSRTTSLGYLIVCFGEVVPGQARPGRRPGRGRLRRRFGHLRTPGQPVSHPPLRLALDLRRPGNHLLPDDPRRSLASEESSGRLPGAGLGARFKAQVAGDDPRVPPGGDVAHPHVLFHVDRLRAGLFGRSHGHQPARPVRQEHENTERGAGGHHPGHRRRGQRLRPDPLGLDVRRPRASERPALDDRHLGRRHAAALPDRRQREPALRDGLRRLLVLWHATLGQRLYDLRLLGHEERGHQLRPALHILGRGGHHRAQDRRQALRYP